MLFFLDTALEFEITKLMMYMLANLLGILILLCRFIQSNYLSGWIPDELGNLPELENL